MASSAAKGSSMKRIFGDTASALAMDTRWLLTAGELEGLRVLEFLQTDQLQVLVCDLLCLLFGALCCQKAEHYVLLDGLPWQKTVVLKDRHILGRRFLDRLAIYRDTALVRFLKSRQRVQKGGLAAAARAEQADEFALLDA